MQLDAARPEAVGELEGEVVGDDRLGDAELLHGLDHRLHLHLVPRQPLRDELVEAELLERVRLDAGRVDPGDLERREHGVARAVPLHVEEGIGDRDRHLVAHPGPVDGVCVNENVAHVADPIWGRCID